MRVLQVNYQMDMMVLSSPEEHSTEMSSSCNSAGNSCGRWALVLHMASFGRGSPSSDSQGISSKETLKKKEKQKQTKKTPLWLCCLTNFFGLKMISHQGLSSSMNAIRLWNWVRNLIVSDTAGLTKLRLPCRRGRWDLCADEFHFISYRSCRKSK